MLLTTLHNNVQFVYANSLSTFPLVSYPFTLYSSFGVLQSSVFFSSVSRALLFGCCYILSRFRVIFTHTTHGAKHKRNVFKITSKNLPSKIWEDNNSGGERHKQQCVHGEFADCCFQYCLAFYTVDLKNRFFNGCLGKYLDIQSKSTNNLMKAGYEHCRSSQTFFKVYIVLKNGLRLDFLNVTYLELVVSYQWVLRVIYLKKNIFDWFSNNSRKSLKFRFALKSRRPWWLLQCYGLLHSYAAYICNGVTLG